MKTVAGITFASENMDSNHQLDYLIMEKLSNTAETVLDMGCGDGRLLRKIAEKYPKLKLTGCDLSQEDLAIAKQKSEIDKVNITFEYCDITGAMPFTDKSFDVVIATATIMMLNPHQALNAMNNMKRLARKKILMAELHNNELLQNEIAYSGVPENRYARNYAKYFNEVGTARPIIGWPGESYGFPGSVLEFIL